MDAYLQAIGYLSLSQDLDAQYNILLYNPAASVLGASNLFQSPSRFVSHDDSTVITYQNGTSATIMAKAKAASDVKFGFQNGQDLYNSLLKPDANSATSNSTSATSSSASSPTATTSQGQKTKPNPLKPVGPGFPVPIVKHSGNYVSGYFLNGSDAGDVAVMAISSFDAQTEGPISEFQRDVQEFLSMCRTSGKRNLIIDVRGNPGGSVILAYDTFKQLFPSIVPYSGIRTRASPAMNALGQIVSDQGTIIGDVAGGLIFDAQSFLKSPDGPYYQNWDQLNGPIELHGDNFTNIASWEFFNATRNPSFSQGVTVSGYGNRTNLPPQAFASKAITLVSFLPTFHTPLQMVMPRELIRRDIAHRRKLRLHLRRLRQPPHQPRRRHNNRRRRRPPQHITHGSHRRHTRRQHPAVPHLQAYSRHHAPHATEIQNPLRRAKAQERRPPHPAHQAGTHQLLSQQHGPEHQSCGQYR